MVFQRPLPTDVNDDFAGRWLLIYRFEQGRPFAELRENIKFKLSITGVENIGFTTANRPCWIRNRKTEAIILASHGRVLFKEEYPARCKIGFQNGSALPIISEGENGAKLKDRVYDTLKSRGLIGKNPNRIYTIYKDPSQGLLFISSCEKFVDVDVHDCLFWQMTVARSKDLRIIGNKILESDFSDQIWKVGPHTYWIALDPLYPSGKGGLMGVLEVLN